MRTMIKRKVYKDILPPSYISGLVDGEGCFALNFRRDKRYEREGEPEYFYWKVGFFIVLRIDDEALLERVKDTLDCGIVSTSGDQARYSVNRIGGLKGTILPFFSKYPLYGKKYKDFLLWSEAVDILYHNRQSRVKKGQKGFSKMQFEPSDIQRLLEIAEEMKGYKSKGSDWKWVKHPRGRS